VRTILILQLTACVLVGSSRCIV